MAVDGDWNAPEPRANPDLIGHLAAEAQVVQAVAAGRMAHAWLIAGPQGIGKASLAYRVARFLLAHPDGAPADMFASAGDTSLYLAPDDPVFRRVAGSGHGDLLSLERSADPKSKSDKIRTRIVIDQIRSVGHFFSHTSAEGGWRIAIVDGADEMNHNAANALLKILEEPPKQSLLLLVAHSAGRLLPTIRSRCRMMTLRPLSGADMERVLTLMLPQITAEERQQLAGLAEGSPGRALVLAREGGVGAYQALLASLQAAPEIDYSQLHTLGDKFARADGEAAFRDWCDMIRLLLVRLARTGSGMDAQHFTIEGEADVFARLLSQAGVQRWAELWAKLNDFLQRTHSLNVDRKQVLLQTFFEIENTARGR